MSKKGYIIKSEDGWWHNDLGWIENKDGATIYSHTNYDLPIGQDVEWITRTLSKYERECDVCRWIVDRRTMTVEHICLDCAIALIQETEVKAYLEYVKMWYEEHDDWKVNDNCRPVCLEEFLDNEYTENLELYL